MIEEVEKFGQKHIKYLFQNREEILHELGVNVLHTGTGRAALRIVLEYLYQQGILKNRNDQILIPRWLCQSVIYTMNRFCSTTITMSRNVKALFVYHQYGFPQDMDKICSIARSEGLLIIEDCANVFYGKYKEKPLGTFGLASIYSFSKMFPSILAGALATTDENLFLYGKKRLKTTQYSFISYASRFLYDLLRNTKLAEKASDIQEMVYAVEDRVFAMRPFSAKVINGQLADHAIAKRIERYQFLLGYFKNRPEYFEGLEREGVAPYVVPLFAAEEQLIKIKDRLFANGVRTGIYHFDVNRNMLDPNFKKCVWIPVHQGLRIEDMERICGSIKDI